MTGTFAGRALAAGALVKLAAFAMRLAFGPLSAMEALDTCGDIALVAGAVVLAARLFADVRRVVLWRVRRKLTLSYIFIGVVPALLIVTFFALAGLLLFFNIGAYMLRGRLERLEEQARLMAAAPAADLQRAVTDEARAEALGRWQRTWAARYPEVSYALVPFDRACTDASPPSASGAAPRPLAAGPWPDAPAPPSSPEWLPCDPWSGIVATRRGDVIGLSVRAALPVAAARSRDTLIVDLPLGPALQQRIREETGIRIVGAVAVEAPDGDALADGTADRLAGADAPASAAAGDGGVSSIVAAPPGGGGELEWMTLLDYVDWQTGATGALGVRFQMNPRDLYRRISTTSRTRIGSFTYGQIILLLLAVVGALFLLIQFAAFAMGLALARSITGSVHELFTGTARVRRGDFAHRIAIRSRDQLGELAESFNAMTASIEELLQQKAVKERLEQELRIAREIQMSLLPQGPLQLPGVVVAAHCEPAREVGGDYYDFMPIDDHRVAVLIADVSGKGTSAALYMAELKGVMLSLSRLHSSPRSLLIDANRILSRHLDTRSFITITYAVIDTQARSITYARAGHTPLIHLPGPYAPSRDARVLVPDGLVLGLQLDAGDLFERLLEESVIAFGPGDLFVLYTDGITEAMNAAGECFGDARLGELVQEHADLPTTELRERILREVQSFAATAAQQDDMTMLLLRVEDAGMVVRA